MDFETMKLGNSNGRWKVTDSTWKFRSLRFSNLTFRRSRYGLTTCRIFDIKLAYMNLFKRKKSDWRFVKIRNTQIITIFKKRFKMYHWRVLSYSRNRFGLRRDCDVLRRCSSDQFPCITNNFTSVSLFLVYQQRKTQDWKFVPQIIDFQNTCQSSYKFVYSHRIDRTD